MSEITLLEIAADRLRSMERLLLHPTPEAIREADILLGEATDLIKGHEANRNLPDDGTRPAVNDFRVLCNRVIKLLEGARRVQWIRMRLIASLAQTYTADAETKTWPPPCGTVNVSM